MTRPRGAVLLALLAAWGGAAAAAPPHEFGAYAGRDTLSNGTPDWRARELALRLGLSPRRALRARLGDHEQFGLNDDQWSLGLDQKLGDAATLSLDGSRSPDANVLPEHSVQARLDYAAGGGWVWNLTARHAEYTTDILDLGVAGIERYAGRFRLAYSLFHGRLREGDAGTSHVVQVDAYYGDGTSSVGVTAADGDEATRVDPFTVTTSGVRSYAVLGLHWFDARWGVRWSAHRSEQEGLYDREGFRVGLLHRF